MKCIHIQTIACQGHSGKRKSNLKTVIFLCAFNSSEQLQNLFLMNFFNTEIFHLQPCHFAHIQTGIQTATMRIFKGQINPIFLICIMYPKVGPSSNFHLENLPPIQISSNNFTQKYSTDNPVILHTSRQAIQTVYTRFFRQLKIIFPVETINPKLAPKMKFKTCDVKLTK